VPSTITSLPASPLSFRTASWTADRESKLLTALKRPLLSQHGTPAGFEPYRFIGGKSHLWRYSVLDFERIVPPHIASSKFGFLGVAMVREDPLLPVPIRKVPDVDGRIITIDDRRIAAFRRMVVTDSKERFRHDQPSNGLMHKSWTTSDYRFPSSFT
jgi:hypothetical protein